MHYHFLITWRLLACLPPSIQYLQMLENGITHMDNSFLLHTLRWAPRLSHKIFTSWMKVSLIETILFDLFVYHTTTTRILVNLQKARCIFICTCIQGIHTCTCIIRLSVLSTLRLLCNVISLKIYVLGLLTLFIKYLC